MWQQPLAHYFAHHARLPSTKEGARSRSRKSRVIVPISHGYTTISGIIERLSKVTTERRGYRDLVACEPPVDKSNASI
jgi:hypothetical protein